MNMTSSGLQCEVAYWPAMTLGGAAQVAAAHVPVLKFMRNFKNLMVLTFVYTSMSTVFYLFLWVGLV